MRSCDFGKHHFIRRHAGFTLRHRIHVESDATAALRRHFNTGTGQPRSAHILDRDNRVGCHQFKTGLDQQLFGKRIADLYGRAFGFGIFGEIGAGHGSAMDAVAPGFGTDIDDGIADAGCGGIENLVLIGDTHGHRIDEDIAIITA